MEKAYVDIKNRHMSEYRDSEICTNVIIAVVAMNFETSAFHNTSFLL